MLLAAQDMGTCELGSVLAALISERDVLREEAQSADLGLRLYALSESHAGASLIRIVSRVGR